MSTPIASRGLIDRIIETDIAYTISRLRILERIPGNPMGVAYRRIEGHAVALMARHIPSPSFNRVVGLRAEDHHRIHLLAKWYEDNGVKAHFEMVPGHYDTALGNVLQRNGYYQSGFHAALACRRNCSVERPDGIDIEAITSAALMEDYLDAYVAGWGLPANLQDRFKANVRPWFGEPGWSLYLARNGGRAAAAAALFIHKNVGYLADAATDPALRRRGLHTALLVRRIDEANKAGAELVFGGAAFFSDSYRNMERIGMQLVFPRALWTLVPATVEV